MDYTQMTNEEIVKARAPYWQYVKTDRNGTRYFADCKCEKCGGRGVIEYYAYVDGGICFDCGGSGRRAKSQLIKIYTPEHEAKLAAQRAARAEKREQERKASFLANFKERFAIGEEDGQYVIYRVAGQTFNIKDTLKEMGCHFNSVFGWYTSHAIEVEGYEVQRMLLADVAVLDLNTCNLEWKEKAEVLPLLVETLSSPSNWQGEIGDKFVKDLTIVKTFEGTGFRGGIAYMYIMKDSDGNLYKWNTAKWYQEGTYTFRCTVKDHSDYNGIKQTVLTRLTVVK